MIDKISLNSDRSVLSKSLSRVGRQWERHGKERGRFVVPLAFVMQGTTYLA